MLRREAFRLAGGAAGLCLPVSLSQAIPDDLPFILYDGPEHAYDPGYPLAELDELVYGGGWKEMAKLFSKAGFHASIKNVDTQDGAIGPYGFGVIGGESLQVYARKPGSMPHVWMLRSGCDDDYGAFFLYEDAERLSEGKAIWSQFKDPRLAWFHGVYVELSIEMDRFKKFLV